MAHPYANAAGYILASDAISQDEYRYKSGGQDEDQRPTHRRRWSFGFRRSRDLSSTNSSGLSSPSATAYSGSAKSPSFSLAGKVPSTLTTPTSASSTAYASPTSYSSPASYSNHSYGATKASVSSPSTTASVSSPSTAASPSATDTTPPSSTSPSMSAHAKKTSNTTAYIISPTRGYVYPDDTWSVMTPGTPSVMRLGFDGRAGARTPDPFGRGVTPDPFGRGVTPDPFGRRTPEPGRAVTGRLTPEFSRAMMRTPEPGGWWAAEASRMWLTPEPDARQSGWAGMGCFTNGKVGCIGKLRWRGRQVKKGVKARARKTAAALRRFASAMKGDGKA
ncbi:hypothetical protein EV121DRAFT_294969 [Schizophyllum commune]